MKAENIIGLAIYVVVALFMVAIGIAQLKSKDPVGFYSGEEAPKAEHQEQDAESLSWKIRRQP